MATSIDTGRVAEWLAATDAIVGKSAIVDLLKTSVAGGKSTFGKEMADFLATPGYSSEEAARFGSHDAYMEHLTGKFAVADTIDPATGLAVELIKAIINDPNNEWQFMLNQPQSLTVERYGQYRKDSFIGGEMLRLKDVYVGKRDGMIGKFEEAKGGLVTGKPGTVEIPFTKAESILDGFKSFTQYVKEPPVDPKKATEETKKVAAKRLKENPIYGSW